MSSDTALINEVWSIVKPHISAKERLQVADAIVELFDDYSMMEGIEHETDIDSDLKVAVATLYGIETRDEEEYSEWD